MTYIATVILCILVLILFWVSDRAVIMRKKARWPGKILITTAYIALIGLLMLPAAWIISRMGKDIVWILLGIGSAFIVFMLWCALHLGKKADEQYAAMCERKYGKGRVSNHDVSKT